MASSSSTPHIVEQEQEMGLIDVVVELDPSFNGVLNSDPISSYATPKPACEKGITKSRLVKEKTCSFQLFQCNQTNEYILVSIEELDPQARIFYALSPFEMDGTKKMKAKEILISEQRVISPVDGEIYRDDLQNKTNLSIEQRLKGKWKCQLRERRTIRKFEWTFSHEKVTRVFRSMIEVATFIIYNDMKSGRCTA